MPHAPLTYSKKKQLMKMMIEEDICTYVYIRIKIIAIKKFDLYNPKSLNLFILLWEFEEGQDTGKNYGKTVILKDVANS